MFCEREIAVLSATNQLDQCTERRSGGSRCTEVQMCNSFVCETEVTSGWRQATSGEASGCVIVRRVNKLR